MRKIYYLSMLIVALLSMNAIAQTSSLNLDFESWETANFPTPTGWDSPNATIAGLGSNNWVLTQETSNVVSGNSALRLETKTLTIPFVGNVDAPGFATLGTLNVNIMTQTFSIEGGKPFTDRPEKVLGSYKYSPVGNDNCLVEVVLLNYDEVNNVVLDTIGVGIFMGEETTTYENFEATITYLSTDTPNFININILASFPDPVNGSILWIDDLSFFTAPEMVGDLFFSEYIEGSSFNKALEIYNPTGTNINLDDYRIVNANNGNGWSSVHTFPSGATLNAGDVWVIVNSQINAALFDPANANEVIVGSTAVQVVNFNGDDARALIRINGNDTIWLDIFGNPDLDPGAAWSVAGTTDATKEYTLVRKPSIMEGNTNWEAAFGTSPENSEWVLFPQNTFDYLGFHNTLASNPAIAITSPDYNEVLFGSDISIEFTVSNFTVGAIGSGADGHLHYSFDGGPTVMKYNIDPIEFSGLSFGTYEFIMWLVDSNHDPLVPHVADTVIFTLSESNLAEILFFSVPGQVGSAIINGNLSTVSAYVIDGSTLSSLIPTIEVSEFAEIDPASGVVQDFTNSVTYTVTAQDGSIRTWEVSVSEQPEGSLFFSEYIEGSSNNKALEIYNPTAGSISLDSYQIAQTSNGSDWIYFHTFPSGAVIAPGGVWVIITNQFNTALFNHANANEVLPFPSVAHYNGNDARAIIKIEGNDTIFVDVIGVANLDPGIGWDVAGETNATQDHTLIRKPGIIQGNNDWASSAGTDASNSEWIVNPIDFVNLGNHFTGGNMAPIIAGITLLPMSITENDTVVVAATITDSDGTVSNVSFDWGLDGISFPNSIALSNLFSVYTTFPTSIPAHPQGTTVYFRFTATDDLGAESVYVGQYTVISDPIEASIYEIQGQVDVSPFSGQIVITSGIVTGLLPGSSQGYFIQDGEGAWNGIFVYDNVNLPAVGDKLELVALVVEYYELTELKEVSSFVVVSSGNDLPEPTLLSTANVNQEAYEGVFVQVENATCTNEDYGYGMWEVNDGSGATLIHNNASYTYTPVPSTAYNVKGVLNYTFSEWKVELRMEGDVSIYVNVNELIQSDSKLYPNPVREMLYLEVSKPFIGLKIFNLLGEQVLSLSDLTKERLEINTGNLPNGLYIIQLIHSNDEAETLRFIKQ